jgi:hypothetical protein
MQRARGKFGPRALGFAGQVAVDSVDHNSVILRIAMPPAGGMRKRRNWLRHRGIIVSEVQTVKAESALVRNSPILRRVPLRRDVKSGGDQARAGPRPR